jgi:hypothetical protein
MGLKEISYLKGFFLTASAADIKALNRELYG